MEDTERTPLLSQAHLQISKDKCDASQPIETFLERHEDPKNWPASRKWFCAFLVSVYALMGPVSSAMVVPALPDIASELGIENESATQAVVSLFVLGWCMGPLFIAPCSEVFGRARMLHLGHFLFLIANTLCAVCTDSKVFLVLRFIAGFVGSAPLSLGGGTMSDLWVSEERGKSLAIYTVIPLSGPAVGAIFGGMLVRHVSWRWIFWGCSIFTALSLAIGLVAMRETFAPILLKRKRQSLESQVAFTTDKTTVVAQNLKKTNVSMTHDLQAVLIRLVKKDLKRPFVLLFTQPIVQALALYMAYLFGLNYLSISTFQSLFLHQYHQTPQIASLNYISIALGFVLGCQLAAPMNDRLYARLKSQNDGVGRPEYRTYLMVPASIILPLGLLLYGWSAEYAWHPLIPNLGILTYSFALIVNYQCIQAYAIDCYPVYAASAIGALSVMRCIGGFAFPILGPVIYRQMGYGWASTMMAGMALVIGGISPWLFMYKGPEWRGRSTYAAGDAKVEL